MNKILVTASTLPAVLADIAARVANINPVNLGHIYDSLFGHEVRVLTDMELDQAIGFDDWFKVQSNDVKTLREEYAPGCYSSPEYFWRSVWSVVWCEKWNAAWHAAEKPGPFTSSAVRQAVKEGKNIVVMEGLS